MAGTYLVKFFSAVVYLFDLVLPGPVTKLHTSHCCLPCKTYRAFKGSAQAANSTVFQEMAPLFLCTYSIMKGSPLHMTSPKKMAHKI